MSSGNGVQLRKQLVEVEGITIHVVEGGTKGRPAVLFLHGWPQNWRAFEQIMLSLGTEAHVVAIDLPGVGASITPPQANDKRTLAKYIRALIGQLDLHNLTLVGHDAGGMITYAYLHAYPETIERAVIMNVAIPGVDPWSEIIRNPYIWHFAFHAIPDLPEKLVTGKQADYFAYFYDQLTGPVRISEEARKDYIAAYSRPEALQTGFEWYRTFPQDEKDNLEVKDNIVKTPVLYLRGERERGDLEVYLKGFRENGLQNIKGGIIPDSGHFPSDEQPEAVLAALRGFIGLD